MRTLTDISPLTEKSGSYDESRLPIKLNFSSYGVNFALHSRIAEIQSLPDIADYLPYNCHPLSCSVDIDTVVYALGLDSPSDMDGISDAGELPRYRLSHNGERINDSANLDTVLTRFEKHAQLYVAEHATERLFVHAGVVGWQGKAIVIPARSFSGKSSLVASLLQAGATYYSDEYALFDEEGQVWPFPLNISLRARDNQPARSCTPNEFGAETGVGPLPVGLLLSSKYKAEAIWQPEAMSIGQALFTLLDNTVPARTNPQFALPILQCVATQAKAIQSDRGEANSVIQAILSLSTNS